MILSPVLVFIVVKRSQAGTLASCMRERIHRTRVCDIKNKGKSIPRHGAQSVMAGDGSDVQNSGAGEKFKTWPRRKASLRRAKKIFLHAWSPVIDFVRHFQPRS